MTGLAAGATRPFPSPLLSINGNPVLRPVLYTNIADSTKFSGTTTTTLHGQ